MRNAKQYLKSLTDTFEPYLGPENGHHATQEGLDGSQCRNTTFHKAIEPSS